MPRQFGVVVEGVIEDRTALGGLVADVRPVSGDYVPSGSTFRAHEPRDVQCHPVMLIS